MKALCCTSHGDFEGVTNLLWEQMERVQMERVRKIPFQKGSTEIQPFENNCAANIIHILLERAEAVNGT